MKLIYKEKKGNKRTIHLCGIKFTYNKKRSKAEFFKIYETIPLLEKSLKNAQTQDTTLLQSREKDVYYYLFENIFYDKSIINRIQKEYVKFIPDSSKCFLDIGCGRGEFLEILKENNIKVKGVEVNSFEVNILNNKGFDVINTDGISYLMESSENFCGISAIQVVEHMSFDYLYKFVHIAYERLIEGGILILETLDPQNIENLKYFYTDLTHIRPIPNLSLQFLCEKAGFKNIKLCKSLPNKGGYVNYALIAEKSL